MTLHLTFETERSTVFSQLSLQQEHLLCLPFSLRHVNWEKRCGRRVVVYYYSYTVYKLRSPAEAQYFSSSLCVRTSSGAHPASYPMGTGGPFPSGKARPGRDADHSPPSSVEVKNKELYSSPRCRLHGGSGTALYSIYRYFSIQSIKYASYS
jgi:hypothetical protein